MKGRESPKDIKRVRNNIIMKQIELARLLGVSEAYISMVLKGKKVPSQALAKKLALLGVNQDLVNFEANSLILSHARLPVPTLPHV
jgi:transcriptional regulator with XRE-family HTH domain